MWDGNFLRGFKWQLHEEEMSDNRLIFDSNIFRANSVDLF